MKPLLTPSHLTRKLTIALTLPNRTLHSTSPLQSQSNRILSSIRTPPTFHDYLRLSSANNTLLLCLFTTSACTPCRTITPLLTNLIQTRAPKPSDKFSGLAFAELELDSGDTSNGNMMELGTLWGVNSLPMLIGFGGRRADRVTERMSDVKVMVERGRMEAWVDEQMGKGDGFSTGGGGGEGKGILGRLFG